MSNESNSPSNSPAPQANAMEGGVGVGDNPNAQPNPKAPAQKEPPRFLKAKVNGKEELVTEEALLRDYQKYRAGEERLQQASQKEKQIQGFLQQLESDPEAAFKQTGLSREKKKELAEKWLLEQLEEEMRDPREAELMELKAQLEQYQSKEKQTKEEVEREAFEKEHREAVQKRQEHLKTTFTQAIEISPLASDPDTAMDAIRSMALHYRLAKQSGYEPDPAELAQSVEERHLKSMWAAAQKLDGESLVRLLGKDITKKLRAYDLAQWEQKAQAPAAAKPDEWQSRETSRGVGNKTSLEELHKQVRRNR